MRSLLFLLALVLSVPAFADTPTNTPTVTLTATKTATPTVTRTVTPTPYPTALPENQWAWPTGARAWGRMGLLSTKGGRMQADSVIVLGEEPGQYSVLAVPMRVGAGQSITVGQVVALGTTGQGLSVAPAGGSQGAERLVGVALHNASAAGSPVLCALQGVVSVRSAVNGVAGGLYYPANGGGAALGSVTTIAGAEAAGSGALTPLSITTKFLCLEDKVLSSTDKTIKCLILP